MNIKFFPHKADIEFEVYGDSLEEVFERAALAVFDSISPVKGVKKKIEREIELESGDLLSLIYDFLEQILILHDSENLVFCEAKVKYIQKVENGYVIKAVFWGEKFDEKKHKSGVVVKAITYHTMKIGEKPIKGKKVWYAHIVLDI
jgi:SHS2 domain-containing protein